MKKLSALITALMLSSSAALAGDFNNTNYTLAAEGKWGGLSVGKGSTQGSFTDNSRVIDVHGNTDYFTVGLQAGLDGSTQDYKLYLTRRVDVLKPGSVTAYARPEINWIQGDSYASKELSLEPSIGVEYKIGNWTPFAELGLSYKSYEGNYTKFSRSDMKNTIGVNYEFSKDFDVSLAVIDQRSSNFTKLSRDAAVKLTWKY